MFERFLSDHYNYRPDEITNEVISKYLRHLVQEVGVSRSFQNQMINAIKFYYERVLGSPNYTYAIDRPRKEKLLPTVLTKQEIKTILRQIKNEKHQVIVYTLYSLGLRISEALNLQRKNIDFDTHQIHLVKAKGSKDRVVPMPLNYEEKLKNYLANYNPESYVFQGPKGEKYSAASVRKVIKRAVAKAKIEKVVTPHTFRHSFATHPLESGVSIRNIQVLLGHNSIKTTEIYTQVTRINLQDAIQSINSFFDEL